MRQFFDDELTIDNISPTDAADWRSWLAQRDLSEATVRLHCRNAKRLFNVSVEQELIDRNPFKRLKSTSIAAEKSEYTGLEVFEKLLEALPDTCWSALVGLARLAGLPSALRDTPAQMG